jgi:hypothetical protein
MTNGPAMMSNGQGLPPGFMSGINGHLANTPPQGQWGAWGAPRQKGGRYRGMNGVGGNPGRGQGRGGFRGSHAGQDGQAFF